LGAQSEMVGTKSRLVASLRSSAVSWLSWVGRQKFAMFGRPRIVAALG
jgi:hypothetical protein